MTTTFTRPAAASLRRHAYAVGGAVLTTTLLWASGGAKATLASMHLVVAALLVPLLGRARLGDSPNARSL
jgi:hypothetical protein